MTDIIDTRTNKRPKNLDQYKTLLLNADFQPMSYHPLSLLNWKDVMFLIVKGEVTGEPRLQVLEEYSNVLVRSPSREFVLPSVVAHTSYIKPKNRVAFTKFNVFLRDNFTCQYTGEQLPATELTFDHVIPRSKGGGTNWSNIVTCSRPANYRKADRTPEEAGMVLLKKPSEPTSWELRENGRKFPPNFLHESWDDYLYWDTELEKD